MTRSGSRTCSSATSFLRVTRSAPRASRERRKKSWKLREMRVDPGARPAGRHRCADLAEMQVKAPTDSILEVLSVKVGDVLPANREVATLILPATSVGARFCSGTVARIDQGGRAGSRPRRFVSRDRISPAPSSRSIARPNSRRAMCKQSKTGSGRSSA